MNWRRIVAQAVVAGLVAGALLMLYLYVTTVVPNHSSVLEWWQSIGAAAIGRQAYTGEAYAWLGLLVHFVASVGWAGGYAYFAKVQEFIDQRWLVSGLAFGIIVYVFREVLLLGAGEFVFPPTPLAFLNDVFAHAVFFGAPVAFVVGRMDRSG
jgi:uncharacterized membrane protein YagU involved in acid resistance